MKKSRTKKNNNTIPVKLSLRDRELVLNHVCPGPELIEPLKIIPVSGKHIVAYYSLNCLDELVNFIAASANNEEDKKVSEEIDSLFERLSDIYDSHAL